MARDLVQTRADADTIEALENYADETDISRSEAIRRLMRTGLAHQGHPVAATDGMGELTDRLDEIEEQHRRSSQTHTLTLVVGLAYVAFTIATGAGGVAWGLLGVGLLIALTLATVARNIERN